MGAEVIKIQKYRIRDRSGRRKFTDVKKGKNIQRKGGKIEKKDGIKSSLQNSDGSKMRKYIYPCMRVNNTVAFAYPAHYECRFPLMPFEILIFHICRMPLSIPDSLIVANIWTNFVKMKKPTLLPL